MANLGQLTLDLVAKIGGFTGPLDKAERQAKKSANSMISSFSDSLKSATKWGIGIGVGATAAAVAFAKSSIDAAGAIKDVSDAAGVTTDTLQEMRHAASLSGISFDELDGSMQQFNKRVGELRSGSGSLYSYLKKVDEGLLSQVKAANSTDDALNLIYKAMKNVTNESERAALAAAAFGRSGIKMALLADDFEKLRMEAQSLGLVIDSQLIENADEAGDKLETMSRIIKTQLTSAMLDLAPSIQAVAQGLIDLAPAFSWILGGEKRANNRQKELEAITKEMQDLIALQNEWKSVEQTQLALKAQKGSLFNPETLKEAQNNIETIKETIRGLNADQGKSKKTSGEPVIEPVEDRTWYIFGEVVKKTSDANKQRLEIIQKSNAAIAAENNKKLDEDIARDAAYHQLVDEANIAQLNNIENDVERELALHEYKFEKLRELYTSGSAELTEIEKLQAAERQKIVNNAAQNEKYIKSMQISDTAAAFDMMTGLTEQYAGRQSAIYKVLFLTSKAFALADAIIHWQGVVAKATDSAPPPYNIPAIIAANIQGAAPVAAIVATTVAGMAHDGMDSIPETGTWLLKKGERVTTERTSKKLDNTLNRLQTNYNNSTVNNSIINRGRSASSGESHYHFHTHGNVFLNRSQMRDAAKMLMREGDRERTRIGAVN